MYLLCCITLQIACVAREHLCWHITGKPLANLTVSRQKINTLDGVKVYKNTLGTCGTTSNILQIHEICMDGTVQ